MTIFSGCVTHLASGDLWGGAEALVLTLAREQHAIRPGSVRCIVMNPGQLADRLVDAAIPTLVLDERRQSFRDLLRSVRAHVRQWRPHVLHAHRQKENLLAWLGGYGLHASDGRAPRIVTSVHGMPEPVRGGNPVRRVLKNFVNRTTLSRGFDAIVAVSQDIANALQADYSPGRVICIHNGVTLPPPHTFGRAPGPVRLLALGRLVPIKRFDRLKALAEHLCVSTFGQPLITLAGEGPLKAELTRSLEADVPAGPIQMPGFVADTVALLERTDGLVITSDHEGIPMAALEALAMGVPVFGFCVGGLPEIASSGVPMRLAPAYDVAALAREIVNYFTEHAPGTRRLPPADWSFDIRQCAHAYDRLYSRV